MVVPADCQPSPVAPFYQLGLLAQITNGLLTAGPVSLTNLSANICGVVTVVGGPAGCPATAAVTVPADGQHFPSNLRASLTIVPGQPVVVPFQVVAQPITSSFACGSSTGGLGVSVSASVEGTTSVFGVTCPIGPFTVPLTGTLSSPDSFSDINGHLTSGPFSVPGATVGPTCPQPVAANLDALAGLPTPSGLAHFSFDIHAALYAPGPPP